MGYGYDLEAGARKIPEAIDAYESFITTRIPQVKELVSDAAKKVNADKLTKICDIIIGGLDATAASFKGMLGADGDKMSDGTLYGAKQGIKQMDEALNGGL